ncbi:polysaccharide biosynthesis/export family protein [Bordetella sp. BOR01]|uniref:polysaccharide biosynthesis/export family protein n=1 Tax=Bordetella sp. BOR01 TaxID=2854779 RepID=UPI001C477289|nr:polysaccharide biosynthesis/export family protein [Bordetella sp. BOR01]MBV7486196.1 polysaccharide biosynthesis/export family protein [Bordetella sp. BOR01]
MNVDNNFLPGTLKRGLAVMALVLPLAGCGILSGAGPYSASIRMVDSDASYTLVDLSAQTIGPYLIAGETPPLSTTSDTPMPNVRLVSGDVLRIMISDSAPEGSIFAPLSSGGTVFDAVRVNARGDINLPYAGRIRVQGLALDQVAQKIEKNLSGKTSDPQVHVELVGDLSGSVLVAGTVKAPGRFSTLQGPLTLLDAINLAGGPIPEPHLTTVTVRTGKSVRIYNYKDILDGRNMPVPPRSEIIVERARKRFVAMGAVTDPGLHDLPSENPSLLETMGSIGGLKEAMADPTGVFIFRRNIDPETNQPKAVVFQLNMRNPESIFLAGQFLVKPEDAIYVTNAAVYEWQKIISPIVQAVLIGNRF